MPFKPFPGKLNRDGVIIIPKGYVKLPEPAVSDYIIPTNSHVSSMYLGGNLLDNTWSASVNGPLTVAYTTNFEAPAWKVSAVNTSYGGHAYLTKTIDLTNINTLYVFIYFNKISTSYNGSFNFNIINADGSSTTLASATLYNG